MSIKFVIFASLLQTTRAWYLAYNAEEFSANDSIPLYTNKIFSDKTQLNFAYTELPFVCKPKAVNHKLLNLGEVLRGDRIAESDLELRVGQNVTCKILCGTDLLPLTDLRFARSLVTLDYKVEWIVDDLPAANLRHFQVGDSSKILQSYDTGFSLGSLLEKGNTVLLNNHFDLTILYSDEGKKNKFYIVGFEIKTKSSDKDVCPNNLDNLSPYELVEVPYDKTDSVKDTLIYYSYSVSWIQEKDIKWANRWDRYISSQEPEIHWYSIINSMIIILFLSGMVAIIILRSLNSDIAMYNSEDAKEDPEDTVGWKLLHGDVFRPPRFSGVLCAFVGSGIQFSLMFGSVVFLSVVGFLNPAFRGGLTSTFAPGIIFTVIFLLNFFVWYQGGSNAVPFTTLLILIFMWFGISTPLILLGAFYGFRKGFNHPVRTNKIPRQVPDQLWYMRSRATILMSGAIPFLVILLELFFIMKSLWKVDQYYYMFGFLGLVSSLLVLTCVEMTIVVIYFSLSSEQWQWHWRAFLVSGSSALYIFAYSCYYYTSVLEFEDFLSTVLYFTYSLLGCFVYWLCTGTLGFLVVHAFILKIYSSVKID